MDAEKKEKGLISRILKIVGIVLAGFVVVVAGAVGIAILSGQFEKTVIRISHIYFDDDINNIEKTVNILEDQVINIQCKPANATETKLTVEVSGNENGVIDIPSTITAGKDFTIKVNKDEKGNNIGGVVTITARSNNLAVVTIRVVVDTSVPDNSLYFTGSNDKLTTSGKSFTLPISTEEQYVYLKSNLVNAFDFRVEDNKNIKNVEISYSYNGRDAVSVSDSELVNENGSSYYKIPILATESGKIQLTARMHRTAEIENAFRGLRADGTTDVNGLDLNNMLSSVKAYEANNSQNLRNTAEKYLLRYYSFLKTYVNEFDTSEESVKFFKEYLSNNYLPLSSAKIEESFKYVYVSCTAEINVTGIVIDSFTTISSYSPYQVFSTTKYTMSGSGKDEKNIMQEFDIDITPSSNANSAATEQLKEYAKENMVVKTYLYLEKSKISGDSFVSTDDEEKIKWAGKTYSFLPVYGFETNNNNKDVTPIIEVEDMAGTEVVGYLLLLEDKDEYIYISQTKSNGERLWELNCNTPLDGINGKALYLCFEVSGMISSDENDKNDEKDVEQKTFRSFTNISVTQEDYDFNKDGVDNISILTLSDMAINSASLKNDDGLKVGSQDVSIDSSAIKNYDKVSYKNIMYFVESGSNKANNASKVVTVGKYNFVSFTDAHTGANKIQFGGADLVGERIPTLNTSTKAYCLKALNASDEPVKVFAVVYLSDKNGNPVDINGRKISFNEQDQDSTDIPTLVVMRITSLDNDTKSQFMVNSYLEEINFYTNSEVEYSIGDDDSSVIDFGQGYLRRNVVGSYLDNDGNEVSQEDVTSINKFLKLKLLKNYNFKMYLTPFTLSASGDITDEDEDVVRTFTSIDGKKEISVTYPINTRDNKQLAFNLICENYLQYGLDTGSSNVTATITPSDDGGDTYKWLECVIRATSDSDSGENLKYTMSLTQKDGCTDPFSTRLTPSDSTQSNVKSNWVSYEINKLEVNDVQIDYEQNSSYNKLYATYANIVNNSITIDETRRGEQQFSTSEDSSKLYKYYLTIQDGNVNYGISTNLLNDDGSANLDLVDCSQANTDDTSRDESETYANLIEYITAFVTGNLTYSAPTSVMAFEDNYQFSNKNDNTYGSEIYFGNKTFAYDPIENYVDINGYRVEIQRDDDTGRVYFEIKKGEYFPVVVIDRSSYMLIFNELFVITQPKDNSSSPYIADGNRGNITLTNDVKILLSDGSLKTYSSETYLVSYTDSTKGAINPDSIEGNSTATINFQQGEQLGVFVEDTNGTYKLCADGHYELLTEEEKNNRQITKYSPVEYDETNWTDKKGVMVYLLVAFNIGSKQDGKYDYTFYRTISYELVQENIGIVGYNGDKTANSTTNRCVVDSNTRNLEILVGSQSTSGIPYIVTSAFGQSMFFDHVKFSLNDGILDSEFSIETNNGHVSKLIMSFPHISSDTSINVQMEYTYKGKKNTANFYILVKADVTFDWNGAEGTTENQIELEGNSDGLAYSIKDIIVEPNYTMSENIASYSLALDSVVSGFYINNDNGTLVIDKFYAYWDGSSITSRSAKFNITLTLNDGSKVTVKDQLTIVVKPTYIIDMTQLTDSQKLEIYNGECLFGDYIKLYNGNVSQSDIKDGKNYLESTNDAYKDFDITSTTAGVSIVDGKVSLATTPKVDTEVSLTIKYNGTEKSATVVIKGITMLYSASGNVSESSTDLTSQTDKNISISVESLESFDFEKYFSISLAGGKDTIFAIALKDGEVATEYTANTAYTIAYGYVDGAETVIVEETGYTFTLIVDNSTSRY